ncbi:uncharacterized protein LOC106780490 [Vigna radiata var. radiata]|uniref:Uncharacterized protein LOC106780490 n=1 Tax=Vigna radiata var. radiata TaxID=3916 RepID=A0A1S3W0S3_VIGRR|nr:uncharacterized protein LOC106780490 [Vigna radiata var. radiata]
MEPNDENGGSTSREEQEEALVALIEHRAREVKNLRHRFAYYKTQLHDAEKRLQDSESKLARLRGQTNAVSSRNTFDDGIKTVKTERRSNSPIDRNESSIKTLHQSKPELLIPSVNPKISQPVLLPKPSKASVSSNSEATPGIHNSPITGDSSRGKSDKSHRISSEQQKTEIKDKGTKRKFEQKEQKELIPLIRKSSSPSLVHSETSNHVSSQHKRKLRSIALCPVNDQLFVTSALDGMVNFWQIQAKGAGASRLSTTDCASQKQRRWPEDLVWHPEGNSLFAVYSADGGDSQVSITNLNKGQEGGERVKFLEDKPHVKGIINGIVFMPWENTCFVTGGSDHAVVLWSEQEGEKWKPKVLHRNLHSSAVMGVAGMQHKQMVLSVGADRRIFGYDVRVGRADFKHQVDSKCMSVLPNPCDFNLFMVQTGTHERQLRLFDIRLRNTELHAFGWKQESSDSQSALINQSWSPDGLYITSGSADPVIHIFDIRYTAHKPSQSIRAHQKRVFRALWLQSIPLVISISSDLNIGLHKVYT